MFYQFARPLLFKADAETAHNLSLTALKLLPIPSLGSDCPSLAQIFAGLRFANPVGLAPGYDKNAEVPVEILNLGFGFTEVGTLTPLPQAGNPKPRLFRLVEDAAVINRMGFNNAGQQAAISLLRNIPEQARTGPIGINIGANKDSADRVADYVVGVRNMEALADYLTVNISSPNTPGLRALQDKAALDDLLAQVMAARTRDTPVFLKVAPDLQPADIDDIVVVAMARGIAALIVSNTTISRPTLLSGHAGEAGGLSGAPLRDMAQQRIIDFRKASGGQMPLIGVGGIASAQDAYARLRAGASLVQAYSALVYQGPGLARRINKQLARLLQADGFTNITEAIGVDG
ncbi:quinone-dependent dihydroorotate dehydrogenase [Sphingorhabdus sp.]|jgi:dihydroorotate dehydrogenase|uniref:quinone-dependent dihydroorotate dehydrogenase n=1 Tax=Sphingorhabdus sp. TaxID=1902408 RepID=UPI002FD99AF4